jgi:hypothetical protein
MKKPPHESLPVRALGRARRYIVEDAKLKVLALLIVTVIWFSVAGQTRTGAPVPIRNLVVTLANVPPGLAVTDTDHTQATIMVEGPDDLLRELRFEVATQSTDLAAYADLTNLKEGVQVARLEVRGLPDGVTLRHVDPEAVRVTLDQIVTREFEVDPRFAGALPGGYKLSSIESDPPTVHLTGPTSFLDKIEKVPTTTVSLSNRTESFSEPVNLVVGEDIAVDRQPTLHVTIEANSSTRSFVVPVTLEPNLNGESDPQAVMVTLRGPVPALSAIRVEDITATVGGAAAGRGESVAPIIHVGGTDAWRVEVDRIQPGTVRVKR